MINPIKKLYKYTPLRIEFFENFLLRAPTARCLNDPFEVNPSDEYFIEFLLNEPGNRFGKTREEIANSLIELEKYEKFRNAQLSFFDDTGIISLSETNDNLLMWSHYADEHQGIVIEFDISHDFFNNYYKTDYDYFSGKLHRVMYRKVRPNSFDFSKNSLSFLEPFITKSNEWIYEKEHRLLVKIHDADRKLIIKNHKLKQILKSLKTNKNKHSRYTEYKDKKLTPLEFKILNEEIKIKKFSDDFYEIDSCIYPGSLYIYPKIMFMFKIPEDCIKSIILGSKINLEIKDKVINIIKKNEKLKNCKIFESLLSRDKYEVIINRLS